MRAISLKESIKVSGGMEGAPWTRDGIPLYENWEIVDDGYSCRFIQTEQGLGTVWFFSPITLVAIAIGVASTNTWNSLVSMGYGALQYLDNWVQNGGNPNPPNSVIPAP